MITYIRFLLVLVLLQIGEANSYAQEAPTESSSVPEENYLLNESKIEELAFQVLNAEKEEERLLYNEDLKALLKMELAKPSAIGYPFNKLQSITVLTPPDSSFKLFNWNIPSNDGTYLYECGVLKRNLNSTNSTFYFLTEIVEDSLINEQIITSDYQWLGGLIYEIIQKETELQTYYTLLVWDGNNLLTKKKRIDVLWFDQSGDVRFGAPIFNIDGSKKNRIQFEYSAQNSMDLNFDSKNDRILFDHLSPPNSSLEGIYEYYGADLSFDTYQWSKNNWVYNADVDADKNMKKRKKDFKLEEDVILEEDIMYSPN